MKSWRWVRRPVWIVAVAFTLRITVMGVLLANNPLSWGVNEPAGIARALVQGRGFSSAFHDANWATAWVAPVYPGLLACIFRFFGIETAASAEVAISLNVIFSSLTAVVLIRLGTEQFGEAAGIVAGWAWAMAPPLLFIPWLPWETCLSALVLAVGFRTTMRLAGNSRLREWAGCGAIWSLGALLNPAILAPLPALAIDAGVYSRRWKGPALMIAVCVLGVLPWTARNFRALGKVVPVRSNFWPEVYFGNVDFSLHPTGNSMLYQREGEIQFASDLRSRTLGFLSSQPGSFARLTRDRIVAFWTQPSQQRPYPACLFFLALGGVVQAWRRKKRWVGFLSVLVLYPVVYYITSVFTRHRHPIEPLMYVLAGYALCELFSGSRRLREEIISHLVPRPGAQSPPPAAAG